MKSSFAIFIFILFTSAVMFITGCSNNSTLKKPNFEIDVNSEQEPESTAENSPEDNINQVEFDKGDYLYAKKIETFIIEDYGIKASIYYMLTEKAFMGTLENLTQQEVENIGIEVLLDNGQILGFTLPDNLKPGEQAAVRCIGVRGLFNEWRVSVKPLVTVDENIEYTQKIQIDQRSIEKETIIINTFYTKRPKFYVETNYGVELGGYRYAGKKQSYVLRFEKVLINVRYNFDTTQFEGTIENLSDENIRNISVSVLFDIEIIGPDSIKITKLEPGEKKALIWNVKSFRNLFEVWRVNLFFPYNSNMSSKDKEEITIKIYGEP